MLQFPGAYRCRAHDEGTVRHGVGKGREDLRTLQDVRRTHSRARFAKRRLEGIHEPQRANSEIAHGTGCRADIERIARGHENDAQVVELIRGGQGALFYFVQAASREETSSWISGL